MELKICHLYPDLLNLYGDRGNIICLKKRLQWRDIDVSVTELPAGEQFDPSEFDLYFIGGGQDFEQGVLLSDLSEHKADAIRNAIEAEKVFLAICGGYQLLGNYYLTASGERCDFLGAIDFHTIGHSERMIGDYMFECSPENSGALVVGFENHSGKTYLGSGISPLGRVLKGFGNNGEDSTEGMRYKNVFGCYCHGSMLPKNPEFADYLLRIALENKYPGFELPPLDDSIETRAHAVITKRLGDSR